MITLTRCQRSKCAIPVRDGGRYCHVHAPTPDRKPTWAEKTARKCPEAVGWADMLTGALNEEAPPRIASPCLQCGSPLPASRCHREVCDRCGGTWDLDAELAAAWEARALPVRVWEDGQVLRLPREGTVGWRVLRLLTGGPRTRSEILAALNTTDSVISPVLARLQNRGLVSKEPWMGGRYRRGRP